jgi:hypothetical protein
VVSMPLLTSIDGNKVKDQLAISVNEVV